MSLFLCETITFLLLETELFFLQKKWLHFVSPPWKIPIDDIRVPLLSLSLSLFHFYLLPFPPLYQDYFGEKITLYFTFLSHYTTYLLVPGILGIGTYLHYLFEGGDHSVLSIPIFAFLMAVWATFDSLLFPSLSLFPSYLPSIS